MNSGVRFGQVPNVVCERPLADPIVERNLLIRALKPYGDFPEAARERAGLIAAQNLARAGMGR